MELNLVEVNEIKEIKFCDLKIGDFFLYAGDLYFKMKNCIEMGYSVPRNSINLNDSNLYYFSAENLIQPIKINKIEFTRQ